MTYKPKLTDGCCYAGDLAERATLPLATILYYSRIGLLPEAPRAGLGRPRRQFPIAAAMERLHKIAELKRNGATIPEICVALGVPVPQE